MVANASGSRSRWNILRPKTILQNIVQVSAARAFSRKWLNAFYRKLSPSQQSDFQDSFAQIFRGRCLVQIEEGRWIVDFAGHEITLPLKAERFWLDWDTAVSIIGHDIEIKQTYASLLNSSQRPDLFIDIGANYGTHSLLFLAHGIDVMTFEPNVLCHDYFRECCGLNHVEARIEPVALSDREGFAELWYPEKDTWLGSTDAAVKQKLQHTHKLITQKVQQKRLDDYLPGLRGGRLLVKIDTEGHEYEVLKGALGTLQQKRPLVIFETFVGNQRPAVYDLFAAQQYRIAELPWHSEASAAWVERSAFFSTSATNFIAAPRA